MTLQLKFKEGASPAQRCQVVDHLAAHGAAEVRPLFPDATDSIRSSLYIVRMSDGDEEPLLQFLNKAAAVEFAEREVRRKLVKH